MWLCKVKSGMSSFINITILQVSRVKLKIFRETKVEDGLSQEEPLFQLE